MKINKVRIIEFFKILALVGFFVIVALLSAFFFLPPFTVQAGEKPLSTSLNQSEPYKPSKKAEIVVDEDSGVIRILIEGKPALVIDSSGIQVFGDIRFTGGSIDNGNSVGKDSTHAE